MHGLPISCNYSICQLITLILSCNHMQGLLISCNQMSADYLFQTDKCYDVTFDTGDKVTK